VYHNTFPPHQIERWLDIYAERFRNPVFRGFQSELETVFEERNMYADDMYDKLYEEVYKLIFQKHPYRNPTIGTAKDLKNPSISKIEQFYKDYYVANNMALVIVGDFDTETILPMIKEKFGKWKSGKIPVFPAEKYKEEPYKGREFHTGRYIPIRAGDIVYRAVPDKHPDEAALDFCSSILSNAGTGLFDALRTENKLMEIDAYLEQYNDEGVIQIEFTPKIIGGLSLKKIEKLVMQYIDSLKQGNFSDELLLAIKTGFKKDFARTMENPQWRSYRIQYAYTSGYTWEEYLALQEKYAQMTKEEIVRVANKYFTDNHLVFYNKMGFARNKKKLKKPPYKPVVPKNTEAKSMFAQRMDSLQSVKINPVFVDFNKDFKYADIKDKIHLITANNPANNVFSLNITFGTGEHNDSILRVINHIDELGTETKTYKEFQGAFQRIGASFYMWSFSTGIYMSISGFDEYFEETMQLINELFTSVKPDDKQLEKLVNEAKAEAKTERKDQNELDNAVYGYMLNGKESDYLNRFSIKELKKISSADIVKSFKNILNYETDIIYVGSLPIEDVKTVILNNIPFAETLQSRDMYISPVMEYEQSTIFVYHSPKAKQVRINACIVGEKANDKARLQAELFNQYFGRGMSSILFQEIREFRSLSYSASGGYSNPSQLYPDRKGRFIAYLSTQADKTNEAIDLLQQLITNMPEKPERLDIIKSGIAESINSSKPNFRYLPGYAYSLIRQGYKEDIRKLNLEYSKTATFTDIVDFYNQFIKGKTIHYAIIGNTKKFDLKALGKYGLIKRLKYKDVMKKI
jgi:predicted Zn-dependent peptidase